MALAVSLILLLVVTLIGIAATRGTTAQQRMTANFYDREIAFQNAEAGLRVAAQNLPSETYGRDCFGLDAAGNACIVNPFADPNLSNAVIKEVGTYIKGASAAAQPEYVIDYMGHWDDPDLDTGFDQTFNAVQYGAQGTTIQAEHYRITVRSGSPADTGERSTVTLQATYKR